MSQLPITVQIIDIKKTVRERDGHRCTKCGMTGEQHLERYGRILDVHRLTPRSAYSVDGCVTLCRACHALEPKIRGGRKPEPSAQIQTPRSVVRRIRRIASHLGKDPGDYAAERLIPLLDKDEAKMLADIAKEREQE